YQPADLVKPLQRTPELTGCQPTVSKIPDSIRYSACRLTSGLERSVDSVTRTGVPRTPERPSRDPELCDEAQEST
ncbi:hypothetical protein, partial [Kitasatospora sp. NPDC059327]|uniref:hypothetical protein n=1 Tax=Kitasatospora sp. NPDC059327 TaxID=3346803 RepID=UPI003689D788